MAAQLIGLGLATLDHLMVVEDFAAPAGRMRVKRFEAQGGGMTASALVTASRLGLKTELWSCIGSGRLADWIVAGLEEEGVDLSRLRRTNEGDGPLILVFVDEKTGERRFQGGVGVKTDGPYPLDLKRLEGASCLLVDGMWPKAASEAARHARSLGVPVVADLGGVGERNRGLVEQVNYLVVDENCAKSLADEDVEKACRMMLEMGPKAAVVTLGPKGCVFADASGVRPRPAFEIEAVDTTGAGDCFHGAFCVGVVKGWDLDRIVEFASAAAAINCMTLGGRAGSPTMKEVEAFLKERK